jgi:hypothetical protein
MLSKIFYKYLYESTGTEKAMDSGDIVVNGVLLPLKDLNCLPGCCTRLFSCLGILD